MSNLHLDDNEIKRLHDEGFTSQQIAIVMNCSKSTILNHLKKINNRQDAIHKDIPSGSPKHKKKIFHLKALLSYMS